VGYYQRLLARDQDEAADLIEEFAREQPTEEVYDRLLVPALILARQNRERGELTADDENFINEVTREVVDDLALKPEVAAPADGDGSGAAGTDGEVLRVLCCPARDEEEELALETFRQLMGSTRCRIDVISARVLSAEVLARVREEKPALVLVASLPPGGVTHTRYLCKRLHAHFPDLKILIGRWGQRELPERVVQRFKSAGAQEIGTSLLESKAQLSALVPILAHAQQKELAATP
jgi:hypothetical protein